jgi:hypothetical protein
MDFRLRMPNGEVYHNTAQLCITVVLSQNCGLLMYVQETLGDKISKQLLAHSPFLGQSDSSIAGGM